MGLPGGTLPAGEIVAGIQATFQTRSIGRLRSMVRDLCPVWFDLPLSSQSRRETQGGIVPPPSVLVPGSVLGSCRHGALSSAQAVLHRSALERVGQ